jgi:ketosteroid isomerase-like protein
MKRLLISVSVLVLLVAPQFSFGADVDDLKATVEKMIKGMNSLDFAANAPMIYPGRVNFGRDSAFANLAPTENIEATMRANAANALANIESLNITPVDLKYKVVGNTGIVWGYSTVRSKPKDGPQETKQSRMTQTWVKSDGKWLLLMTHASAIPSGD